MGETARRRHRRQPQPVQGHLHAAARRSDLRIILLGGATQFAYWGVFFWIPAFLARPLAQGGAGMTVVSSLGWIVTFQVGAYLGYLTFGFIADVLGRRNTFILFMVVSAILVPSTGRWLAVR